MKITPTITGDKELQRKLDRQIREQPRQVQIALGRTAEFLMGLIKQRTQKGKNADGGNFAPYTPEYKAFRREKGRQTTFPDLNFKGNMLSNMTQKSDSSKAIIYFASKAQAIKAVSNNKKRTFFAIGGREEATLINIFAKEFKKVNKLI
jgi:hypothetical protein